MTRFGVCLPLFAGSSAKTSEINITEILGELGVPNGIPVIGWVFKDSLWGKT